MSKARVITNKCRVVGIVDVVILWVGLGQGQSLGYIILMLAVIVLQGNCPKGTCPTL